MNNNNFINIVPYCIKLIRVRFSIQKRMKGSLKVAIRVHKKAKFRKCKVLEKAEVTGCGDISRYGWNYLGNL